MPEAALMPTRERGTHSVIERMERPIADDDGRPARPYRAVDTLALMERRGTITAAMRLAGEGFRLRFRTAALDQLRAADMDRPGARHSHGSAGELTLQAEAARKSIWRALKVMGGPTSPGGSCVYHVLGLEMSLKEWAIERGWSGHHVSQEAASGILVAALGALEASFS